MAPGNTIESFAAALEHGVDMIEFDVLRTPERRLVLAHDYEDAAGACCLSLEEGLDHLAGSVYAALQFDVDLKLPGYEREVVEALAERGLTSRSLVSSMYTESLDRLGELDPGLRRGWSVPRVRRDYTRSALALPAYGVIRWLRARLPAERRRASAPVGARRSWPTGCWWAPASSSAVHEAGGEVYVWTVDDAAGSRRSSAWAWTA